MTLWPPQPLLHEVNTWVWLDELRGGGGPLPLGEVPPSAWDSLVLRGVDAVWLMGVWERSPRGVTAALTHPGVDADHRAALDDFTPADVVGSPYCVHRYRVDPRLGGDEGLAAARRALAERGVRLVVDHVPNHVALDHPWTHEQPDLFVQGTPEEAAQRPREFVALDRGVVALGRDPHFEPWQDVAQLNAFSPALRAQTAATLRDIAGRADGVRCDMAMLMTNEVFARTWGDRAGAAPDEEFWPPVIAAVRAANPDFLFVAEVYWDMEGLLLQQGFDYCYDKRLHDRVVERDVAGLRAHLGAAVADQRRLLRFVENHDERRAAAALPQPLWRAAAVAALTLPGAQLLYEGQLDARTVRPPVALGRRPAEPGDPSLRDFYLRLLGHLDDDDLRGGSWELAEVGGWADNESARGLLAWWWSEDPAAHLIVVNLTAAPAQGRIAVSPTAADVVFDDVLAGRRFTYPAAELTGTGLFVDLPAGGFHVLRTVTAGPPRP